MSLTAGSRFGTFEITSSLGAGGMGEVYRFYAGFLGLGGTRNYDVAPGGRFLMIKEGSNDRAPEPIVVVQNWVEELKRLVPTK